MSCTENIYNPVLGQPLPELNRVTTHDRENLKQLLFVQDQIDLNERLSALLGLRFEHYEHDYKTYYQILPTGIPVMMHLFHV